MSEDQIKERVAKEENKMLIIVSVIIIAIWICLLIADVTGFIYFILGVLTVGGFLIYIQSINKKQQDKWIKTSLFSKEEEKTDESV